MSSDSYAMARTSTRSVFSTRLSSFAPCALLGVLVISQAAAAPLTLNTEQNPAIQSSFTLDFGEFGGERTALVSATQFDLQIDPAQGTARFLNYHQNVDPLTLPGGFSTGNITITIEESLGGEFDRTTGAFTTDDVYAVHFDGDLSAYGIESPFILPGSAGGVVGFDSISTGSADMAWAGEGVLEAPFRALDIPFAYTCSVSGVFSSLSDSTWIMSSDPNHDAIDARQPIIFGDSPYVALEEDQRTRKSTRVPQVRFRKTRTVGWRSVTVTMNAAPEVMPTADEFVAEQTWDGVEFEAGPAVRSVRQVDATTFQLMLTRRVEPGAWTTFTHQTSETSFCLGYLPGDSNADATADADDVTYLTECIAGRTSCELWQCDMDRSGACDSADVDRLWDLLDGTAQFDSWMNRSLASSPCE